MTSYLIFCITALVIEVAFGISCPDAEDPITQSICMYADYSKVLNDWKKVVEQARDFNEADKYWLSLFMCADFTEITCLGNTPRHSMIDEYHCTFVFCENGRYCADYKVFQKIHRQYTDAHNNIMTFYKSELKGGISRANSTFTTGYPKEFTPTVAMTTRSEIEESTTNSKDNKEVTTTTSTSQMEKSTTTTEYTNGFTTTAAAPTPTSAIQTTERTESFYENNGWEKARGLFYKCFKSIADYIDAKESCIGFGGRLAAKVFRDAVVVSDMVANGCFAVEQMELPWIGFDDLETEGTWQWSDGGDIDSSIVQWNPGEPNGGFVESCAHVWQQNLGKIIINDVPCSMQKYYICEVEFATPEATTHSIITAESTSITEDTKEVTTTVVMKTTAEATTTELTTSFYEKTGWSNYGNLYYKCFTDVRADYATANATCAENGGRLAAKVLRSHTIRYHIKSSDCHIHRPWIGYDDIDEEDNWRWSDGGIKDVPRPTWLGITNSDIEWVANEPNNGAGSAYYEDCAQIDGYFGTHIRLNDAPCGTELPFICEIEKNEHVVTAESTAAATSEDTNEFTTTVTAPIPTSRMEAAETTTIALTTSFYEKMGWNNYQNLYYKCFTDVRADYTTATATCAESGGRLAAKVLRHPVTYNDIISSGCFSNVLQPWIGYDDIDKEGTWRWSDGASSGITVEWMFGEPNNAAGGEDCAYISGQLGSTIRLNDGSCAAERPFICENEVEG